jgi:delta14-sterol reductase
MYNECAIIMPSVIDTLFVDLFAEKVGFKLSWGCLAFYPFCYNIGCFHLVLAPRGQGFDMTISQALCVTMVFLTGWSITRFSNMQKYSYRVRPDLDRFFCGLVEQKTIPGTRILISGWVTLQCRV